MWGVQQGATERQQKVATAKDLGWSFATVVLGDTWKQEAGDLEGVTTVVTTPLKTWNWLSLLVFCELCSYRGGGTLLRRACNSKVRCMDEWCKTWGTRDGEEEAWTKVNQTEATCFCLCWAHRTCRIPPLQLCMRGQGFTDQSRLSSGHKPPNVLSKCWGEAIQNISTLNRDKSSIDFLRSRMLQSTEFAHRVAQPIRKGSIYPLDWTSMGF